MLAEDVSARVAAAVQKLGHSDIGQALKAKNPWQALQVVGSKPGILFCCIKQDELEAAINGKAEQTYGAAVPNARKKKENPQGKTGPQSLQVKPRCLLMCPNSFTAVWNEPLCQLGLA